MALNLETFKKMSKKEIKDYGKTIPEGYTYDGNGYVLTYKDSNGFWREYTRDENGYVLTFKDSDGTWWEYTRDETGKELTFKKSSGVDIVYFFWGIKYALGYDKNTMKYKAGCQYLTCEECEEFYENYKGVYKDSHDFIEAIRKHQKTLTESK